MEGRSRKDKIVIHRGTDAGWLHHRRAVGYGIQGREMLDRLTVISKTLNPSFHTDLPDRKKKFSPTMPVWNKEYVLLLRTCMDNRGANE